MLRGLHSIIHHKLTRVQWGIPTLYVMKMAVTADFFLDFYQMRTRNGGCGATYRGRMYLWAGQSSRKTTPAEEYGADSDDNDAYSEIVVPVNLPREDDPNSVIDVYDIGDKLWWHCPTHGDVPRMGLGPRMCAFGHSLYLYGISTTSARICTDWTCTHTSGRWLP